MLKYRAHARLSVLGSRYCSMGSGRMESDGDLAVAWDIQERRVVGPPALQAIMRCPCPSARHFGDPERPADKLNHDLVAVRQSIPACEQVDPFE
jgi:hypothetical protein